MMCSIAVVIASPFDPGVPTFLALSTPDRMDHDANIGKYLIRTRDLWISAFRVIDSMLRVC